mgnify:FL=1
MALTKVNRGGLNTGVSDSSNATFLTVDSSEQAVIKSESGAATTSVQQGLAKGWINYKQAATFVINDSFNISGVNDDGTGLGDTNYTNNFGNANYVASGASGRVNLTGSDAYWTFPTRGSSSVYSTSSTSWTSGFNGGTSDGLTATDLVLNLVTIHGDLA